MTEYALAMTQKQVVCGTNTIFVFWVWSILLHLMPIQLRKELIVVGDRVLLEPEVGQDKTKAGLYLPETVRERDKVLAGKVVKIGPGYPVPNPNYFDDEPWSKPKEPARYIPLQVKEGDSALFLRDQAIEVEFEEKKYFVVPQSAILLVVREELHEDIG